MNHNILLGITGSVAAIKTKRLVDALKSLGDVKIITTKSGLYFLEQEMNILHSYQEKSTIIAELEDQYDCPILVDEDEWAEKYELGDEILHIELRRWASCLVLAPLDANTLAKISNGLCDNLLTSVVRAWDWSKPMFICPSMNTMMLRHPITNKQIEIMEELGVHVIDPVEKRLACGDVGLGAMAPVDSIITKINEKLRWKFPLKQCNGIPINHHPGAFGFHRKKNHHTGIDLYCKDKESVFAAEDGIVVKVDIFTGPKLGHNWWEETWGMMIEGASGVINYGEIIPYANAKSGDKVKRGDFIGCVKRVLFEDRLRPDIPGHSTSMLHLELYKNGTRDFADWHDPQKNPTLLDPTTYLLAAESGPKNTLTWDNLENRSVG